jgi:hypothetical protein
MPRPEAAIDLTDGDLTVAGFRFDPTLDTADGDGVDEFDEWVSAYNADGSFTFPPVPADPEQVNKFWDTVPIPEIVLAQFQAAYAHARLRCIDADVNRQMRHDPRPEPGLRVNRAHLTADDAWQRRREQARARCEAWYGPEQIPNFAVRQAVRSTMRVRQLRMLPEDQRNEQYGYSVGEWLDEDSDVADKVNGGFIANRELPRFYGADQMSEAVFLDPALDVVVDTGDGTSPADPKTDGTRRRRKR